MIFLLLFSASALANPIILGDVTGGRQENLHGPMLAIRHDDIVQLLIANSQGTSAYHSAGEVFLFDKVPPPDSLTTDARFTLYGATEHDHVGSAMAIAQGDATVLVVGADHSGLGEDDGGQVLFFKMPIAEQRRSSEQADGVVMGGRQDRLGEQVVSIDLNGDGQDEVLAGSPGRDGSMGGVWLLSSGLMGAGLVEELASARIVGDTDSRLGWRLNAGDLDDDGHPEILVGAFDPAQRWSGRVLIFSELRDGSTLSISDARAEWQVSGLDCYLGWGLAVGPETLISAPWGCGTDLSPRVWSVAGMPSGVETLIPDQADWIGKPGDALGASVAWLDTRPVLGMPGISSAWIGDTLLEGSGDLGAWVGNLGDLDGDQKADLGITAPAVSADQPDQGRAWVISGASLTGPLQSWETPTSSPEETGRCNSVPHAPWWLFAAFWAYRRGKGTC